MLGSTTLRTLSCFAITSALSLSATAATAATWVAQCHDGKDLQYNQDEGGNGFLYMTVDTRRGPATYQIARLSETFNNGTAICGSVVGNGTGASGQPITEVCANQSRGTIYVNYRHPSGSGSVESGVYCRASVSRR